MGKLPSFPYKSRGHLGLALVVLLCLSLLSLYISSVGIARDSSKAQEYHEVAGREGTAGSLISAGDPSSDVVVRFHAALRALHAYNTGSGNGSSSGTRGAARGSVALPATACPAELQLGVRPSLHTSALFGNQCEPWATRRAVLLLHMLLSPGMAGLEWGAGASTLWYLARLSRLVTVEHSAAWAGQVRALAEHAYDPTTLRERWLLQVEPPSPPAILTFAEAESYERFKAYVDVAFLERGGGRPRFDFIAIDGQARLACFQRALWMLKSHGGVLMLNSAQRRALKEVHSLVPSRWLRFQDSTQFAQTVIWVSCEEGQCRENELPQRRKA